jgi:hypothetical protein
MIRTDAWDDCGGPDPTFHPLQHVDVDLSCALRAAGWLLLHDPRHPARHLHSASSPSVFKTFLDERHRTIFVPRWSPMIERRRGVIAGSLASAPEPASPEAAGERLATLDAAAVDPMHPGAGEWFRVRDEQVQRAYHAWLEVTLSSMTLHARQLEAALVQKEHDTRVAVEEAARLHALLSERAP